MSTEKFNSAYMLDLLIPSIENTKTKKPFTTSDMVHMYVIRMPMQKMGNITKVIMPIALPMYMEIEQNIANKIFIDVKINVGLIEEEENTDHRNYKTQLVKSNTYVCLEIKNLQEVTTINSTPLVSLSLSF